MEIIKQFRFIKFLLLSIKGNFLFFKKLHDINNFDNLVSFFKLDPVRNDTNKTKIQIKKNQTVLVIAPHQDDESIGAAGYMLKAKQKNCKIILCLVSDGRQKNLNNISEEESIAIRNEEFLNAMNFVKPFKIYELGINNIEFDVTLEDITTLKNIIVKYKPESILCPWIFDSPPKHKKTNFLLYHAIKNLNQIRSHVIGYQVHNEIFANRFLDITDLIETKIKMIDSYSSQINNFKDYTHQTVGLNAWNCRYLKDSNIKYAELFFSCEKKLYLSLVSKFY